MLREMAGLIKCQVVFSLVFTFFAFSSGGRYFVLDRDLPLDTLHTPLLKSTYDSFLKTRHMDKRSSDWSKRKRPAPINFQPDSSLETQASDKVEVPAISNNQQVSKQRSFKRPTTTTVTPRIETATDLHTGDEGTSEVKPVINKFVAPKKRRPFTFKPKLKDNSETAPGDNPVVIKSSNNPKTRKPLFGYGSNRKTPDVSISSEPQASNAVEPPIKVHAAENEQHVMLEPQTSDKVEVSAPPSEVNTYRRRQRQPVASRTRNEESPDSRARIDSGTTQLPRIIRKMRLQNVPLSSRQQLTGGDENVTSTVEKNGRVVRVRKFKRKTTTTTTTSRPTTTTTKAITTTTRRPQSRHTPSSEFSHITVINKEVRDQKPRRKNKAKIQQSFDQGFGARNSGEESSTSSSSEMPRFREQNSLDKEPVKPRTPFKEPDSYLSDMRQDGGESNHVPSPGFPNYVQPDRTANPDSRDLLLKDSSSDIQSNTSAKALPKSIEILTDTLPYDLNTPEPPYLPLNSFTTLPPLPYTLQPFQNFGFNSFQGGPGFGDYLQNDPFFNQPFPQPPGMTQQDSLGQPFYGRSGPQYPYQRPNNPGYNPGYLQRPNNPGPDAFHRSGGLEFDPSPRLLSLRRSVMDAGYPDEAETTTEFSIPKFEVPPIDFNDKGCRTVYKEVSQLPEGRGARAQLQEAESKAKSFVMTRECFFPDGVPTTAPESKAEDVGVSPGAEQV